MLILQQLQWGLVAITFGSARGYVVKCVVHSDFIWATSSLELCGVKVNKEIVGWFHKSNRKIASIFQKKKIGNSSAQGYAVNG